MLLTQWSSVSSKWAHAVRGALLGCGCLHLQSIFGSRKLSRLNSQLLLQWAPCVRCLYLGDWSIRKEGIKDFVAAAVNLSEVVINVCHIDDFACADSILCASKSVLTIRSGANDFNCYMPRCLPQQLQQLHVLSIPTLAQKETHTVLQPRFEAFLSLVSSMRHLRVLSINFDTLALRCSASLPKLAKLSLCHYMGHGSRLDLSCLRKQHHDQLCMCLVLDRCNAETCQQAVSQLQQIHISYLHLVVTSPSMKSQQVWQSLSQCDSFHVELAPRAIPPKSAMWYMYYHRCVDRLQ